MEIRRKYLTIVAGIAMVVTIILGCLAIIWVIVGAVSQNPFKTNPERVLQTIPSPAGAYVAKIVENGGGALADDTLSVRLFLAGKPDLEDPASYVAVYTEEPTITVEWIGPQLLLIRRPAHYVSYEENPHAFLRAIERKRWRDVVIKIEPY